MLMQGLFDTQPASRAPQLHYVCPVAQAIEAYRQSKRKGGRDGKPAATFASLKALVAGREVSKSTSSEQPIVA